MHIKIKFLFYAFIPITIPIYLAELFFFFPSIFLTESDRCSSSFSGTKQSHTLPGLGSKSRTSEEPKRFINGPGRWGSTCGFSRANFSYQTRMRVAASPRQRTSCIGWSLGFFQMVLLHLFFMLFNLGITTLTSPVFEFPVLIPFSFHN